MIAASSGNHAQGLARAAAAHDLPCTIVMPSDAPSVKRARTEAHGATVVTYDRRTEDRDAVAAAPRRGPAASSPIPPFDHPGVIAGQGTAGLEIAEQCAAARVTEADVLVCTGGGGLLSGIALALEAEAPGLRPPPGGARGLRRRPPLAPLRPARAQRRARREPLRRDPHALTRALTFPVIARLCGPGLTVTDEQALAAIRLIFENFRIVLEPGGAVALAAALTASDLPDTVVVTLSGGNVGSGAPRGGHPRPGLKSRDKPVRRG